jgi:glutathione synthase/RimK-type ligase-like ATP-grasp enzyme
MIKSQQMQIILATGSNQATLTSSDSLLRDELEARGAQVIAELWDAIIPKQGDDSLVFLRSTWDYSLRAQEFKQWISAWKRHPFRLWNPPATVLWNLDKLYLRDLARTGIRIPRTAWFEPGETPDVDAFLARDGVDEAVVKPRISASARGTSRVRRSTELAGGDVEQLLAAGSLLQEFVPEIQTQGEISLIFFGGELSHAVHKHPNTGDFRVQKRFGGRVSFHQATKEESAFGQQVLKTLAVAPLYARVDLVHHANGPMLMELELIEPELYLDLAPSGAARFADEILRIPRASTKQRTEA